MVGKITKQQEEEWNPLLKQDISGKIRRRLKLKVNFNNVMTKVDNIVFVNQ